MDATFTISHFVELVNPKCGTPESSQSDAFSSLLHCSKGPRHECPDYVTSGPNSCHFDAHHTTIWKLYCMNVTAITAHRNYTSAEHCVDVAEIGEDDLIKIKSPFYLSFLRGRDSQQSRDALPQIHCVWKLHLLINQFNYTV